MNQVFKCSDCFITNSYTACTVKLSEMIIEVKTVPTLVVLKIQYLCKLARNSETIFYEGLQCNSSNIAEIT